MPKLLFTDRLVASPRLKAGAAYFDTKTPGLVLRVWARRRTWYFVYRNGSTPEWFKLGDQRAVGLAQARKLVLEKRAGLDIHGLDPAVERRKPPPLPEPEAPGPLTFADFVPTFNAFQRNRGVKEWENDASKITRHLLPAWGTLPLKSITRANVQDMLDAVANKGLTIGVNRVQALISRIFAVAVDLGKVDAHPATRIIKKFPENPRDKVLTDVELRTLWKGLDDHPGAVSDVLRLRLLLGQRGGEVEGMTWAELNLDDALWTLPRKRTKTQKRAHVVALPPTALALLTRRHIERAADEMRVFCDLTLRGAEHRAVNTIHQGAYEWKDLRRTLATRLADLGFGEDVIGRVLNHARYSVTGKHYNQHAYVEEIRQALTAWDAELQRILRHEPKKSTRVLPMRSRS